MSELSNFDVQRLVGIGALMASMLGLILLASRREVREARMSKLWQQSQAQRTSRIEFHGVNWKWPILLILLGVAGCDHKSSPMPTAPSPAVPPVVVQQSPRVPVIAWNETEKTAHHPGIKFYPVPLPELIQVASEDGDVYLATAGVHLELKRFGWYTVAGKVNGVWSTPYRFLVSPNACGGCDDVPVPPPPPAPVCNDPRATRPGCDF